jgi:hypothetical protein
MVEGKTRETSSPFQWTSSQNNNQGYFGHRHEKQSVPDGDKNLVAVQDLHSREDGCFLRTHQVALVLARMNSVLSACF